jgi:hypothetical protein
LPRTYRVADRQLELELAGAVFPPHYDEHDDYDEEHAAPPRWLTGPAPTPQLEQDNAGAWRIVSNGIAVRSGLEDELDARRELHTFEQAVREVRCGW